MLCYAMLCYAMLCYAMLCYAMLCYAMLSYAMLGYARLMLGYARLCYARRSGRRRRRARRAACRGTHIEPRLATRRATRELMRGSRSLQARARREQVADGGEAGAVAARRAGGLHSMA